MLPGCAPPSSARNQRDNRAHVPRNWDRNALVHKNASSGRSALLIINLAGDVQPHRPDGDDASRSRAMAPASSMGSAEGIIGANQDGVAAAAVRSAGGCCRTPLHSLGAHRLRQGHSFRVQIYGKYLAAGCPGNPAPPANPPALPRSPPPVRQSASPPAGSHAWAIAPRVVKQPLQNLLRLAEAPADCAARSRTRHAPCTRRRRRPPGRASLFPFLPQLQNRAG